MSKNIQTLEKFLIMPKKTLHFRAHTHSLHYFGIYNRFRLPAS